MAASLRVTPVIIELPAPMATSSLRLWNEASKPINVQVRIFRWVQKDGTDALLPAEGVVISPPIAALAPNGQNLVRIVRTSKQPVIGEESYRLLVDELPPPNRQAATVAMVVRHSIPLFFHGQQATPASVTWSVNTAPGGYRITAINKGHKRMKVFNLTMTGDGKQIARRDGLLGYVLGGSTASWILPSSQGAKSSIMIYGESEAGKFNAKAEFKPG
nr:molecular chaperone [Agrobacterium vitis]